MSLASWFRSQRSPTSGNRHAAPRKAPSRRPRGQRLGLEHLEDRTVPATLLVTSAADPTGTLVPGTLRYAVQQANQDAHGAQSDTIAFDTFLMGSSTVALQQGPLLLDAIGSGALVGLVTIDGGGSVTISGNQRSHIFQVDGGARAAFTGLTIRDGIGRTGPRGDGGGILNSGTLTATNCIISNNSAIRITSDGEGGGIWNVGGLTMTNCTISDNHAGKGGGIFSSGTLTTTNCTISGNSAPNWGGGGISNSGTWMMANCTISSNSAGVVDGDYTSLGGGISNWGTLTAANCIISGNSAFAQGGGISNQGTLTATNCSIAGNSAGEAGGGISNGETIHIFASATLTMTNCTVSGNSSDAAGGIWSTGMLTAINCSIAGNSADAAGGIANGGTLTATNCTVSGNSAADGAGGILNGGDLTATNCTVASNFCVGSNFGPATAGGILNFQGGTLGMTNCTVAGNIAYPAGTGGVQNNGTAGIGNTIISGNTNRDVDGIDGLLFSYGYNLIGRSFIPGGFNRPGDQVGVIDPKLGPLQDNGGPTKTRVPLPDSPAIDAGSNALAVDAMGHPLLTDQRGFPRLAGVAAVDLVDVGACERQKPTVTLPGPQTAYVNVAQAIHGISVGDVERGTLLTVTVWVEHGTLTVASTAGLTVSDNSTGTVSLSGSVADLNAALAGLVYLGNVNFSGGDALNVTVSDGRLSNLAGVGITVQSAVEQAANLQTRVNALRAAGVLNGGQANSLNAKLNLQGNDGDIGRVQAFLNEVAALLMSGILSQAQAYALSGPGNILLLGLQRR